MISNRALQLRLDLLEDFFCAALPSASFVLLKGFPVRWAGSLSPEKPRLARWIDRSISSENRRIRPKAFESEVPPLKSRSPPTDFRAKRRFSVQHTQKSFSITSGGRPRWAVHPGRGVDAVLPELLPIIRRERALQVGDMGRRHSVLAEIAKGLDDKPRCGSGGRHVLRRGALETDMLPADLDDLLRAVGQVNDLRGPRSMKCFGVKTQPFPFPWIRARTWS